MRSLARLEGLTPLASGLLERMQIARSLFERLAAFFMMLKSALAGVC